jgi:hypothetical protein
MEQPVSSNGETNQKCHSSANAVACSLHKQVPGPRQIGPVVHR